MKKRHGMQRTQKKIFGPAPLAPMAPMVRTALTALMVLCGFFILTAAAHGERRPASHCAPDEAVIFTCPVSGQKLLSVCASQQYGPEAGYLQYRYGPAGNAEMTLPASRVAPSRAAQSGLWMFSGGGGAYVRFANGKTAYYVYTAVGNWGDKGETEKKAGVAVEIRGKVAANILCRGPEFSELGPQLFNQMGLPEVETEFDLPE